jgi:hypothetical protein
MNLDKRKIERLIECKKALKSLEMEYDRIQRILEPVKKALMTKRREFVNLYGEIVYSEPSAYLEYRLVEKDDGTYEFCKISN